jgi:hypothetical protein
MHRIQTGEQAIYQPGSLPARKGMVELPYCRDRRFEGIEDVLQGRNTRRMRPKAASAERIDFVYARVQNIAPRYQRL